jgi:hypothetical protein
VVGARCPPAVGVACPTCLNEWFLTGQKPVAVGALGGRSIIAAERRAERCAYLAHPLRTQLAEPTADALLSNT